MELNERYIDMLIQQSYLNEKKAGSNADSVASKLEGIKDEILREHLIVQLLKNQVYHVRADYESISVKEIKKIMEKSNETN